MHRIRWSGTVRCIWCRPRSGIARLRRLGGICMRNWKTKIRRFRTGTALAAAAGVLALGSPASALEIGDFFDWFTGNGGDGSSRQAATPLDAAAATELVVEISFWDDALEPIIEVEGEPEVATPAHLTGSMPAEEGQTFVELTGPGENSGGAKAVPEPSAALLFGAGALLISQRMRRRL